jgi:hypothetical protein
MVKFARWLAQEIRRPTTTTCGIAVLTATIARCPTTIRDIPWAKVLGPAGPW